MLINSLETMENIVKENSSLTWIGWDVAELKKNPAAYMQKDGAYIGGKWYTRKLYALSSDGWEIPTKFVR